MKKVIFTIILMFMFVCTQAQINAPKANVVDSVLVLETFTDIPDTIEGCGCFFSASRADYESDIYTLVADMAELAFVKINGKMVVFNLLSRSKDGRITRYSSDNYKMTVKILKVVSASDENEAESELYQGVIIIDGLQKHCKQSFYGLCGC